MNLIVGMGEVGQALHKVLSPHHNIRGYDVVEGALILPTDVQILHICFPYSDSFSDEVRRYRSLVQPDYVVIHSTVPVGTSKALGAYHSPVRGNHPRLAESMIQFTTYLAPRNAELEQYFIETGMTICAVDDPGATEAGKLWCLAALATSVILEKSIYKYCQDHGLDFDLVYTHFTGSYNEGYLAMGKSRVYRRPVLEHMPGPIGGHCVMPATRLLDSPLARFIENQNLSTEVEVHDGLVGSY